MSIGAIVLILLALLLVGLLPIWSHSKGWGYGPSGGLGLLLIIIIIHNGGWGGNSARKEAIEVHLSIPPKEIVDAALEKTSR